MGRRVDAEDGLREMADLWSAETADALHRVLVLHPPIRATADTIEPMALLQRHHETEPGTSPTTAMLLLTDRRWQSATGRLARAIADSDILADEHIDVLAEAFVAADDALFWQVPDDWFAYGIDITISTHQPVADTEEGDEPEGPTVARRDLPPPLRRWATAHMVGREPDRWAAMITRAGELSARHAAATMAGLMDAIDAIEPPGRAFVVDRSLASRDHGVRRLALQHLAEQGDVDRAYALATADANRRIRDWADELRQPSPNHEPSGGGPANSRPQPAATSRVRKRSDTPTLF